MKVYRTQEEFLKDCKDGYFKYDGDIKLEFNLTDRVDIKARDIKAQNIKAQNITAQNITAQNINARDINAWDITARDINAQNINYYAVCFAYHDIKCTSIKGRRGNSKHFCLDGEITIKKKEEEKVKVTIGDESFMISKESYEAFRKQFNNKGE